MTGEVQFRKRVMHIERSCLHGWNAIDIADMGYCNDVFNESQRTGIVGNDLLDGNVLPTGLHAPMHAADIDGTVTGEYDIGADEEAPLSCILDELEISVR